MSSLFSGSQYVTAKREAWRVYRIRTAATGADRLLAERAGPAARDPYEQLAERDQIRLLAHLAPAQRRVLCLVATGHSYKETAPRPATPTPGSTATSPKAAPACADSPMNQGGQTDPRSGLTPV